MSSDGAGRVAVRGTPATLAASVCGLGVQVVTIG